MRHIHLILSFLVLAVKKCWVFADEVDFFNDSIDSDDVSLWSNVNNGDGSDLLNLADGSALAFNNVDNDNPALFVDDSIFNNQEVVLKEAGIDLFTEENQVNNCNDLQPLGRNRARSNEVCHDNQNIINLPQTFEGEDWLPTPEGLATDEEVASWFCPVRFFQGILQIPVCNIRGSQAVSVSGSWASLAKLPLKNLKNCWPCKWIILTLFISSRLFCMHHRLTWEFRLISLDQLSNPIHLRQLP